MAARQPLPTQAELMAQAGVSFHARKGAGWSASTANAAAVSEEVLLAGAPKGPDGSPLGRLFIGDLPPTIQHEELRRQLAAATPEHTPTDVRIYPMGGYAFVEYGEAKVAAQTILALRKMVAAGQCPQCNAGWAQPRSDGPQGGARKFDIAKERLDSKANAATVAAQVAALVGGAQPAAAAALGGTSEEAKEEKTEKEEKKEEEKEEAAAPAAAGMDVEPAESGAGAATAGGAEATDAGSGEIVMDDY